MYDKERSERDAARITRKADRFALLRSAYAGIIPCLLHKMVTARFTHVTHFFACLASHDSYETSHQQACFALDLPGQQTMQITLIISLLCFLCSLIPKTCTQKAHHATTWAG